MKNELQELTVDQFRLELNRLDKQEKELNIGKEEVTHNSIYNIQELPMSISNLSSWVSFLPYYFWPIQTVLCYFQCFQNVYSQGPTWVTTLFNIIGSASTIGNAINGILMILITISILLWEEKKHEGILSLFRYIRVKTFPFLRYIIGFYFHFTSFIALDSDPLSLTLFILAAVAILIKTTFLNNFTLRKDQFCCKSFEFMFLNRILTIVSLALGIIAIRLVQSQKQLLGFVVFQAILGITTIITYFNFGIYTFRHKVPRFLLFFLNVIFCAVTLAMLFDILQALGNGSFNFYIHAFLLLIVGTYLTYQTLDRRRRLSQIPQNKNLKEKIFFLFNKFESSDIDNEDDSEIRGVLHYHQICGCKNPHCVVNFQEIYDSKKKKMCSIHKIAQSKVSLVKFYVKCLLETAIQEDPQNTEIILDYLQFYYLKLKNIFVVLKMLIELEQKLLSPIQRLRVVRLKRILKEESNFFSEDLFLGRLSMETVLKAEEIFDTLVKGIDLVLQRNLLFWRYIARNDVFLADILELTKSNFNLVDSLSDKWLTIAKYFDINRRWKIYFLCYTLYIKNEKLKPSMYQELGNSIEYDSIFKTSNYFIDKTTQKEVLFNPIMLFEQSTCFIVCSCDEQKMLVKRVSNFFNRLFEYQAKQIIDSHLHELMPPSIRSFHHKMVIDWAKFGKNRNQSYYTIKKVMPMTKKGYLAPCFKFYKYYILNSGEIQYIAMLKKNKQEQMTILVNQNFEIEAMTHILAQKMKINSSEDYSHFQGLNLLSLIPMLAKYTYYAKQITQNDDDFHEMDENQSIFKKQNTFGNMNSQQAIDILGTAKQLNLTNIKIIVPSDIQGLRNEIKSRKKQATKQFDLIRESYSLMRKKKSFLKFKADLCVRQLQFSPFTSKKFYYVEINQLEENNRLQKMKLEELRMQTLSESNNFKDLESNTLMDVDIQTFLQVDKQKNKIVLFPSDNIFIKDQNNQALANVSHIAIINSCMRLNAISLILLLFGMFITDLLSANNFNEVNTQFTQLGLHQKFTFLLNSQYNIQHIQPGNGIEISFYIVFYTQEIISNFKQKVFSSLLYDIELNSYQLLQPYFKGVYPYPILKNMTCLPQDQLGIFSYIHQSEVSLHRMAQVNPHNTLEVPEYHIFNNYIESFYNKTQSIKANLIRKYQNLLNFLTNLQVYLFIIAGVFIVLCFLFIISRLLKVTNGFSQLVSIFIQMDNADIRKITKFSYYTIRIFDHLKDRYQRMKCTQQYSQASSSNLKDLEKPSSQMGRTEEMMAASVGANLNKKIKKLEAGFEIFYIKRRLICLLLVYLILLTCVLSIFVVYSKINLSALDKMENMGFTLITNNSVADAITTGLIQRFRKANIFRTDKYTRYFDDFNWILQSSVYLNLAAADNQFGSLLKMIYYGDFCTLRMDVFNSTFDSNLKQTCGSTNLAKQTCDVLFKTISDVQIVNRCQKIQSGFLNKGATTFYSYLNLRTLLYFNNGSIYSLNDVIQINDVMKIIGVFDIYTMRIWLSYVTDLISNRMVNLLIIVATSISTMVLLHFIFVQILFTNYLSQNYEVFRRMHEYLIPEFVINKEKIIKAKLIRQGFMKE